MLTVRPLSATGVFATPDLSRSVLFFFACGGEDEWEDERDKPRFGMMSGERERE